MNQGGAVNRILEVECTHDKLFENPQDTIDILKKNYGFAGKDFVAALEEMSVDKIKNIQQEILKKSHQTIKRINSYFPYQLF